jgi:hypothetical protein
LVVLKMACSQPGCKVQTHFSVSPVPPRFAPITQLHGRFLA